MFDVEAAINKGLPKLKGKLPKPLYKLFIHTFKALLHEKTFCDIHQQNHHLTGLAFIDNMLNNLKISYTVKPHELKNIPATGRLIVVANHITGASDALTLTQAIAERRDNRKVKLLANGVLMGIEQIAPLLIPVDNINGAITRHSLQEIDNALENDEVIIIFPAGVVNRLSIQGLKDTPWKASFLKVARRTSTPIVPIRIDGRNSILFYLLSALLPKKLSGLLLPREFALAGKRAQIHLNIGKVIPVESFSDENISFHEYLNLFYAHLYALGTSKEKTLKTEITIGTPRNRKQLKEEVEKAKFLGFTNNGKKVVLADAMNSPFLISELGRVREMSFRAIGGGTGTARDNDAYDNYYKHLILWDDNDLEVVGAYRIGECKEIIETKGLEGLYTANLCDFNQFFNEYSDSSVELGRSFVQPKYWGSRAFDSLWQAVTLYLAHHPNIRYTYGVVTINADTPQKAVAALVYFYTHHFACKSKMMTAKYPYIMSEKNTQEFDSLFKDLCYKDGFIVLKKYLKDLGTVVPTLFKQYVELYEEGAVRYFDFSVNEGLFGVTEGFIISDNHRMKKSIQDRNLKEFNQRKNIDTLTQLHSAHYFKELLAISCQYKRKADLDSSIIVFNIDLLSEKEINEKILIKVARSMEKTLRDTDIIARWSDNEFIVVLKNVNDNESKIISENLKSIIQNSKIDGTYTISCSFKELNYYDASLQVNKTSPAKELFVS